MTMSTNPPPASDATPTPGECWCETCRPNTMAHSRMILCPVCGNKRCPRATHHDNACTGSNEPGQKGSSWENYPTPGAGGAGDVGELERLARAATPGPWHVQGVGIGGIEDTDGNVIAQAQQFKPVRNKDDLNDRIQNAAFIAAANPAAVLALIDRVRAAEAERDEVQQARIRTYEICADSSKRLIAERDALRAAVEKIPDIIRKSGEPGHGGVDITRGIPSVVYVGIGRERYEDGFDLARETAEYTRDEAAGAVEVFIRAALARGSAAGETTDGGGKD
jgi:hypothetical protein